MCECLESSFQEPLSVAERQARNLGSTYHTGDSVRDQGRKNTRRDILYRSICRLYFITSFFLNYMIYVWFQRIHGLRAHQAGSSLDQLRKYGQLNWQFRKGLHRGEDGEDAFSFSFG